MGIIAALKKKYKYLYLKDVLSFYDLNEASKNQMKESVSRLRRGTAGVDYGKPVYPLDAAKYTDSMGYC